MSDLNAIGVLKRREIEARILAPFVDALAAHFDRSRVIEILRETVVSIAREQGAELAAHHRGNVLSQFAEATTAWVQDDALTIEVLAEDASGTTST